MSAAHVTRSWIEEAALRSAAYHEAGHATMASLYAFSVKHVVVREPGSRHDTAGACEVDDHLSEMDDRPFRYLVYLAAGMAAEQRGTGRLIPDGDRVDRAQASALASVMFDCEPTDPRVSETVARAARVARALIAANWTWTKNIADALVRRRRLTGADVHALHPRGVR